MAQCARTLAMPSNTMERDAVMILHTKPWEILLTIIAWPVYSPVPNSPTKGRQDVGKRLSITSQPCLISPKAKMDKEKRPIWLVLDLKLSWRRIIGSKCRGQTSVENKSVCRDMKMISFTTSDIKKERSKLCPWQGYDSSLLQNPSARSAAWLHVR